MNSEDFARLVRGMSEDVKRLNAGVLRALGVRTATPRTDATTDPASFDAPPSALALLFERHWRTCGGPELTREYRFDTTRRWRADYAHPASRVLIEIEGGIYKGGRHTRAAGFVRDAEKYNRAATLGYVVFRLPTGFTRADVAAIVAYIADKEEPQPRRENNEPTQGSA